MAYTRLERRRRNHTDYLILIDYDSNQSVVLLDKIIVYFHKFYSLNIRIQCGTD